MTTVISYDLYSELVQELRLESNFSKLIIRELVSELRKDAFYIHFQEPVVSPSTLELQNNVRQQLKTHYTGKKDYMDRLLYNKF